jgi:serine/threonine protein kinase
MPSFQSTARSTFFATDPLPSSSIESVPMGTASIREDWEGRTVDGKFALLEWLGGSADHGVFLTLRQGAQRAVIKLIVAEGADADAYLAQWEVARTLSHPHLMPLLETGRFEIEGVPLVYVLTEHAERVLSKFLSERALHAHEAKDLIEPVLDALSYLHAHGFVHGHVKPSNILVSSSELKLSADDFFVAPGVPRPVQKPGAYDAPEVANGMLTSAADTWSVGMTLVEALTQNPPAQGRYFDGDPVVPRSLPQPFFEIVRECLRSNPSQRYTVEVIKARLESNPPPSVAARQVAPTLDPIPVAPNPISKFEPVESTPLPTLFADYEEESSTRFPVRPVVIGVLVLLAVVAVVFLATNKLKLPWPVQTQSSQATSQAPAQSQPQGSSPSDTQSAPPTSQAAPPTASPDTASGETQSAPATSPDASQHQSRTSAPSASDASIPSTASQVEPQTQPPASHTLSGATTNGAVAQRVLPNVSSGARESMHGPVTVEVRVFVDRSGAVSNAAYVTQGPGNYFARISVRAAESWKFTPPQPHGHPEPSVWTLHFYFTHGQTEVTATEESHE